MKNKFLILYIFIIILPINVILLNKTISFPQKNDKVFKDNKTGEIKLENEKEINFTFVGDLLFEPSFYDAISNGYNTDTYFKRVNKYFIDDDISLANMEVIIGNDSIDTSIKGYSLCAPKYIGDLVSKLDLQVLSTVNNHANDRGINGIISSIDYFKNNTNILTVGTYKDETDRKQSRIIDVDGVKVGFLAYTNRTNKPVNSSNRDMIALFKDPISGTFTKEYKDRITAEVDNLKKKSDIVVVMVHWGREYLFSPNEEMINFADFLNKLGVDIIVGSHSHTIQPIDIIGDEHKTLVYYSMGNFASQDNLLPNMGDAALQRKVTNAYQIGLLSKVKVKYKNNKIEFSDINTIPVVNYYDKSINNFELVPFDEYTESYEKTHRRYNYGLNRTFIDNLFNEIIDEKYQ